MKRNSITYCNMCGKEMNTEGDMTKREGLHVEKEWGYFSGKDGEIHRFDLCEECYDTIVHGFLLPPEKEERSVLI